MQSGPALPANTTSQVRRNIEGWNLGDEWNMGNPLPKAPKLLSPTETQMGMDTRDVFMAHLPMPSPPDTQGRHPPGSMQAQRVRAATCFVTLLMNRGRKNSANVVYVAEDVQDATGKWGCSAQVTWTTSNGQVCPPFHPSRPIPFITHCCSCIVLITWWATQSQSTSQL
jgi:hypothetical protein